MLYFFSMIRISFTWNNHLKANFVAPSLLRRVRSRLYASMLSTLHNEISTALQTHPGKHTYRVFIAESATQSQKTSLFKDGNIAKTTASHHLVCVCEGDVLIYAIEGIYYPSHSLLYISKVDSTGYNASPSPARMITSAYLRIASPGLRVHVFARSQQAYIFPLSKKKILDDAALVRWWRSILSDLPRLKSWVIVPGLDEIEALSVIGRKEDGFNYGVPYTSDALVGQVIPYFPDDPKSRFLDELVTTPNANVMLSPRKDKKTTSMLMTDRKTGKRLMDSTQLVQMRSSEFWDLMGHRQECAAGRVVGFLVVDVDKSIENAKDESASNVVRLDHKSHAKLLHILMDKDYSTLEKAKIATKQFERSASVLAARGQGEEKDKDPFVAETDEKTNDASAPSIWTTIHIDNPAKVKEVDTTATVNVLQVKRKAPAVNVLQPRKKVPKT